MKPKLNLVETGSEENDKITVHITKHKPDNQIVSLLLAYIYITNDLIVRFMFYVDRYFVILFTLLDIYLHPPRGSLSRYAECACFFFVMHWPPFSNWHSTYSCIY